VKWLQPDILVEKLVAASTATINNLSLNLTLNLI